MKSFFSALPNHSALAIGSALAVVLTPVLAFADVQAAGVDWQRRVIRVTGQAAPDQNAPNISAARLGAERAAKMDAMRNIVETLKGVQVTGAKTGADALTDPGVSSKVTGMVRNFTVVDKRYYSDGAVELDVEMPLDGLVGTLVPRSGDGVSKATTGVKKGGLVVDARGVDFVPALAPRVVDEDGKEIYGPSVADPAVAKNGLAAYAADVDAARKDARVTAEAVVVKAVALASNRSEVVLSADDARKARELSLASGNVVFVTK